MKPFRLVVVIASTVLAVLVARSALLAQSSPCCSCACVDDGNGDNVGQMWRCEVAGPPDATHCAEDFVFEQVVGEIPFCGGGRVFAFPPDFCVCVGDMCSAGSDEACAKQAAQACFNEFDGSAAPCDVDGNGIAPDLCTL